MVVFVFDTPPVADLSEDLCGGFAGTTAQVYALATSLLTGFFARRVTMDLSDREDAGEPDLYGADRYVAHAPDIDTPVT